MNRALLPFVLFLVGVLGVEHVSTAQEKPPPVVEWQKLLVGIRTRFAKSTESTLRQTRIDRAYFKLNEDDPDQPPYLHIVGVALQTAFDNEKAMRELLHKELSKITLPNTKYVLKIDEIRFFESPIYTLQTAAVAQRKTDPALNVFFERAEYDAAGQLHLGVLFLQKTPNAKVNKLVKDRKLPAALTAMPVGKSKGAKLDRRDYDWLARIAELRRKYAASIDPLMQRSRVDDGWLEYTADKKGVRFLVQGMCVHPPALVADKERQRRWSETVSNLFAKVRYDADVTGIAMTTNPCISWQDDAAGKEPNDGVFFHLAQFDPVGKLKFSVMLPTEPHRQTVMKIIADRPVPAPLEPIDVKNIDFQPWPWAEVLAKAQGRLAKGEFLLHRTRLDRIYWRYEPTRGDPVLHFDGVSLHPTEIEPAAKLRARLERSFLFLPPSAIEHKFHTEGIRFLPSPIYALQTEAVAQKLDGALFADGFYDELGKLHLHIAHGTPAQRETTRKLVEAFATPAGVIRPTGAKDQPILHFTELAWSDILAEMQRWLARDRDTLLRKTRLDRAFFSYPPSKVGPDLNLALAGIYPKAEVTTDRLRKRFESYALLYLDDQLRAGPIAAVPFIDHVRNPATIVQAKVYEAPLLDGVRLDDASFDADGKLILHGIWVSKKQEPTLEKLARDTLTPGNTVLQRGFNWQAMQQFDSPRLLYDLRVWVADQQSIDEVRLERIFFDALGKVRVAGFATRPTDKEQAEKKLPELLPLFPNKKLPPIEGSPEETIPTPKKKEDLVFTACGSVFPLLPTVLRGERVGVRGAQNPLRWLNITADSKAPSPPTPLPRSAGGEGSQKASIQTIAFQEPKDDGPIVLETLTNIAEHLRKSIPSLRPCDGLRIDRCFYDPQGVFRIEGLADHDGQFKELKPFLDGKQVPFDPKRQLPNGWDQGRQTIIPLRPMMVSLAEHLPSLAEFDGLALTRAHHDDKNRLVLTGNAIGGADAKQLTETLRGLIKTHPRWNLRLKTGLVLDITDRVPADPDLAKKLVLKAFALLQVNIGEAYVVPLPPTKYTWWSHAWPFDDKLPRVRPTEDDYERCLEWLNAAVAHDPRNVQAWYLRGYCWQAQRRPDLTLRDFRRMVTYEIADPEQRHNRILALELVQGRLRQSAFEIEQQALLEVAEGWTLRRLTESPAAPDATKE